MLFGKERVYEVMVRNGDRWVIDCVVNQRKKALTRANILVEEAQHPTIKVTFTQDAGREEIIFEQNCTVKGEEPVTIVPIEEAYFCESAAELHQFDARHTIGRIFRKYLDNEGLTPWELVFDQQHIKQLMRLDRLSDMAIQRIATLQARAHDIETKKRISDLYNLVKGAQEITENISFKGGFSETLSEEGLNPVIAYIDSSTETAQKHLCIGVCLAHYLGEQRDWPEKLILVMDLLDKSPEGGAQSILDEICAEIIDSPMALKDILGPQGEHGSVLTVMAKIASGKFDSKREQDAKLLRFNELLRAGAIPLTHQTFIKRIANGIKAKAPFTRSDVNSNREAFSNIITALVIPGGLFGGPEIAASIALKTRVLMKGDMDEDLPIAETLSNLMKMIPDEMTRVGFLLDLSASSFGEKFRTVILRYLLVRLGDITVLNDMLPDTALPDDFKQAIAGVKARLAPTTSKHAVGEQVVSTLETILSGKIAPKEIKEKIEVAPKNPKKKQEQGFYKAGEIILKEGKKSDCIFLILSGEVDLSVSISGVDTHLATVSRGGLIGEMSLIGDQPHMATATAKTDCKLSSVPASALRKKMQWLSDNDPMLHHIMTMLVERLRKQPTNIEFID